jgi:hypothetical protein
LGSSESWYPDGGPYEGVLRACIFFAVLYGIEEEKNEGEFGFEVIPL